MSADFTPTMHGYTGQGAFKFWCQKVLPLVYDDSLSYYELLCKVVNYLNNVISDVSATESNVQSLYDSFVALQNYVNDYFDNLDVAQAVHDNVNAEFNEYVESDTFKALVDEYVNDYLSEYGEQLVDESVALKIDNSVAGQIDDVVAEQLPQAVGSDVTTWLNENVDPVGSAVVVDSSLSVAGAAADAKETGDGIRKVDGAVFETKTTFPQTTKYFGATSTYLNVIANADNFHFEAGKSYNITIQCTGLESATMGDMTSYGFRAYKYENGSYVLVEAINSIFASGITDLRNFVHGGEARTGVYTPSQNCNAIRLTLNNSTGGVNRGVTISITQEFNTIEEVEDTLNKRVDKTMNSKARIVCNMGDSIFGRFTDESDNRTISELIAEQTEAEVHNFAFSGSIVDTSYASYARKAVMFVSLAHAIATGNFTALDGYAVQYPEYAERIADIKAMDYTKVDIITVAYGTNDWYLNCSLNRYSNGIINGIKEIQQEYPNIRFILITPIIRFKMINDEVISSYDARMVNEIEPPLMIGDYADRMEEVGLSIDCMVIDDYHNTGITTENQAYFLADKVHPNIEGRKIIANRVAKAIESY